MIIQRIPILLLPLVAEELTMVMTRRRHHHHRNHVTGANINHATSSSIVWQLFLFGTTTMKWNMMRRHKNNPPDVSVGQSNVHSIIMFLREK